MRRLRRQARRQAVNSAVSRAEQDRAFAEAHEEHEAMRDALDPLPVQGLHAPVDQDWLFDDDPPDPL